MSLMGAHPAQQFYNDASSTNITASSGSTVELEDATTHNIQGIEVFNTSTAPINLYVGPTTNLQRIAIIPPADADAYVGHLPRQPCCIPKGMRLSVRATDNAAISAGLLIINTWA